MPLKSINEKCRFLFVTIYGICIDYFQYLLIKKKEWMYIIAYIHIEKNWQIVYIFPPLFPVFYQTSIIITSTLYVTFWSSDDSILIPKCFLLNKHD